jgi:hypothetical protein
MTDGLTLKALSKYMAHQSEFATVLISTERPNYSTPLAILPHLTLLSQSKLIMNCLKFLMTDASFKN